ncbi:hypothetical protein Tco_1570557, partial [Tanacetum coccineum]
FLRRPTVKGAGLHVADSHTGNQPEDDFTPFETIRRLCSIFRRRSHLGFEGETSKPKGRCAAFEEVAKLKDPFVMEKMAGYHPSSKQEYDQAGDDLVNASYPFFSKYINDPYDSLEQLFSKKPESLRSKPSYVKAT